MNKGIWTTIRCNISKTNQNENIIKETIGYFTKDIKGNYIIPRIYIETIRFIPKHCELFKYNIDETNKEIINYINSYSPKYISNISGAGENKLIEREMLPILKEKLIELNNANYYQIITQDISNTKLIIENNTKKRIKTK